MNTTARGINGTKNEQFSENLDKISGKIAYGRYWGALERVDCLHFEACYYLPIEWCFNHGYQRPLASPPRLFGRRPTLPRPRRARD
jgi:Peptidogalycan biosysnthesis/recognition